LPHTGRNTTKQQEKEYHDSDGGEKIRDCQKWRNKKIKKAKNGLFKSAIMIEQKIAQRYHKRYRQT